MLTKPFPLGEKMPEAPAPGVDTDNLTLEDGTQIVILQPGVGGRTVQPFDAIRFRYAAFKEDGAELMSNADDPVCDHVREDFLHQGVESAKDVPLTGLAAAVRNLTPGTRARIYVPVGSDAGPAQSLASGKGSPRPGAPDAAPKGEPFPVVFDFALLDVIPAPKMPSLDESAGTWRTVQGIRYRFLKRGEGGPAPKHYAKRLSYALWNEVPWMIVYSQQQRGRQGLVTVSPGARMLPMFPKLAAVMNPGDRLVADVPPELAFGARGNKDVPPNSRTRWILEVEDVVKSPAPPDFETNAVTRTESGLEYYVIDEGQGPKAKGGDVILAHYGGWLPDGTPFDNSYYREEPITMTVGQGMIDGWAEALPMMRKGSALALKIPANLAYGDRAQGVIPANSTLHFVVRLEGINPVLTEFRELDPDKTEKTDSGLEYEVLEQGTGIKPRPTDQVMVHYYGWLTDGNKFDASLDRGRAAKFQVGGVIPGWTEGLQLMREGGHALLRIPSELGYGERGSGGAVPPNADLVFSVRLVKVIR